MSKFQGVIDAAKSREDTAAAKPASLAVSTKRLGRGRPPGKRSDPDFEQGHCLHSPAHPPGRQNCVAERGQRPGVQ